MTGMGTAVRRSVWLLGLGLLLWAARVEAAALRVELVTKVRVGNTPVVKVVADQAATDVVLALKRDDGQDVTQRIGSLGEGETREIQLDGAPGKHHYRGRLKSKAGGTPEEATLSFDTVVAPPLEITVDKSKVDLEGRRLEVVLSREAATIHVKLLGVGGNVLGEEKESIAGQAAGQPIGVTWRSVPKGELVRIELRVTDADGFFNGIALIPWSVSIPHEQVNFDFDSDKINRSEEPKLEDSFKKIKDAFNRYRELGNVKLFIAGHTDTHGAAKYNLELSRRRARSIAAWFAHRGLTLPIFSEGFGEFALLVKTADEVKEARNRRVDYILSIEEPNIKSKGHQAVWKRVNQ
jgi:outer membrane protein OmpA-like peptidoglycan-associated protein